MKIPRKDQQGGDDNHLIPLINVVFLMLIFFMVIGRIAPPDRFQVRPPISQNQQPANENSVSIIITRDGSLAVDGTAVTLETLITTLQVSLDAARGQQGEAAKIQIKADAALTAGDLTRILERLRDSGQSKVRLLTRSDG